MGKCVITLGAMSASATVAESEVNTTYPSDKVTISNKAINSKDLLSEGMSNNNAIEINDL